MLVDVACHGGHICGKGCLYGVCSLTVRWALGLELGLSKLAQQVSLLPCFRNSLPSHVLLSELQKEARAELSLTGRVALLGRALLFQALSEGSNS